MPQPIKKEKFTTKGFQRFVGEMAAKSTDLATASWKDIVRNEFLLDEQEEASLANLPKELSDEVQADFTQIVTHLETGGKVDGKIIENKNKTHTIIFFLEAKDLFAHTIVFACCDANCRNWKWGKKNCSS